MAFIGVILLTVFVPIFVGSLLSLVAQNFAQPDPDPRITQIFEQLPEESADLLLDRFSTFILRLLLIFLGIGALLGTAAAVWLSGTLTAPLSKLATAARAIGARDLSQRVNVKGTQEIDDLAEAFNDMATHLERAELQRQNLLNDVAHELRTPVTVIQGNLRAILDDVYPLDKEEVAKLYEQTRHLGRLIEDLRELAQAEAHQLSLNLVRVNLPQLVKDSAEFFKPLALAQNVELRVELLGELPDIQADRARLRQSLTNLLENALRHTPENGSILLQAESVEHQVHIHVIDSGDGIEADALPHVFDRFYREDKSRARHTGGSGLGLTIVRAIAEMHGGTATAVSPGKGQGATFTLSYPIN